MNLNFNMKILNHIKLLDLPVLSDIVSFVDGLYEPDLLNFSCASRGYREFITRDPSMNNFWFHMLRRTTHKKLNFSKCHLSGQMLDCYPQVSVIILDNRSDNVIGLNDMRKMFGECFQDHYRCRLEGPNPNSGFNGRDMYEEWQVMMWKRQKRQIWNIVDDRKLLKLENELALLKSKKEFSEKMGEYYGPIVKKQLIKNKKKGTCE